MGERNIRVHHAKTRKGVHVFVTYFAALPINTDSNVYFGCRGMVHTTDSASPKNAWGKKKYVAKYSSIIENAPAEYSILRYAN